MKKLLLIIMMLCATLLQAVDLDYPADKWKPANTAVMMHFDGNYTDDAGNTWVNNTAPSGMDGFTTTNAKFGQSVYKHNEDVPVNENSFYTSGLAPTVMALGTSDFTVEYWIGHYCHNTMSTSRSLFSRLILSNSTATVTKTFRTYINRAGTFWAPTYKLDVAYVDSLGTPTIAGADARGYSSPGAIMKWWHICHERRSGVLYSYIDGIEVANGALAIDLNAAPISNVYMSLFLTDNQTSDSYIDEFRVTKGRYIYGGAFTPIEKPFRQYAAPGRIGTTKPWFDGGGIDPKVTSLLRYDEITGLYDSAQKTTWVRTTLSPSLGITSEAMKFGVSGQKFTMSGATINGWMRTDAATATPFLAGTGDFTMEYWVRLRQITESSTGSGNSLNNFMLYKSTGNYWIMYNNFIFTNGNTTSVNYAPSCQLYTGSVFRNQLAGSTTLTAGNWTHVSLERVGGTMTIYINGVANAVGTGLASTYDFSAENLVNVYFQHSSFNAGSYAIIDIDEFMFYKGGYLHGGNFTPPTAPLGTTRSPKLWMTSTRSLPQQTGYSYAATGYVNSDAFAFPIDPGAYPVPVYANPAIAVNNGVLYPKCSIATGSAKFGTYGLSYKDSTWTTYGSLYCQSYNAAIQSMTNQVDFWFRPDTIRQPASAEQETLCKAEFRPSGGIKYLSYEIVREGTVDVGTTTNFTASLRAIYYDGTNSGGVNSSTFTMNAGQWYHLRFERSTGWGGHYWVTGYVDGVQVMQVQDNYVANGDLSWVNDMMVGNWGTRGYIDYSVDEILYKKVPTSASPFTPPTTGVTITTSQKISFLKD